MVFYYLSEMLKIICYILFLLNCAQKNFIIIKIFSFHIWFFLQNILPDHVASYYLASDGRSDELYAKMHKLCGVMFASIPNFQDFYSEDIENGKACIRILNEIICDFDSLMDEPRFATVEKIKSIGATFMAASGLNPKHQVKRFLIVICNISRINLKF